MRSKAAARTGFIAKVVVALDHGFDGIFDIKAGVPAGSDALDVCHAQSHACVEDNVPLGVQQVLLDNGARNQLVDRHKTHGRSLRLRRP